MAGSRWVGERGGDVAPSRGRADESRGHGVSFEDLAVWLDWRLERRTRLWRAGRGGAGSRRPRRRRRRRWRAEEEEDEEGVEAGAGAGVRVRADARLRAGAVGQAKAVRLVGLERAGRESEERLRELACSSARRPASARPLILRTRKSSPWAQSARRGPHSTPLAPAAPSPASLVLCHQHRLVEIVASRRPSPLRSALAMLLLQLQGIARTSPPRPHLAAQQARGSSPSPAAAALVIPLDEHA